MKFIKILIIGLIFTACTDELLNPEPISSLEEENFFTNDSEVFSGVVGMYDAIQGTNISDGAFDNENDSAGIQFEFYLLN